MNMRRFKPASIYSGKGYSVRTYVKHWTWRKGKRLTVTFTDGRTVDSDYRGLRELYRGENVIEQAAGEE